RNRRVELRGDRVLAGHRHRHGEIAPHARASGAAPRAPRSEDRMKPLTCAGALHRLHAYCDGELTIGDQLAVTSHVQRCRSCADAMATDAAAHARWTARFQAANESAEQDAVFALAAAISREGRIAGLDRLRARGLKAAANDANLIESLMDAVSRARLDGQIDG